MWFLEKLSLEVYNQFLVYLMTMFILDFLPEGDRDREKEAEIDGIDGERERERLNILIRQIFITSQIEFDVATKLSSLLAQPFIVSSRSFLDS